MRETGRYAPSPTGPLHLGNLRTALAAWLAARSRGGRFLVRVEDLDGPRVRPGMQERQLADLAALGIDWDDEPLRQSTRGHVYAADVERLWGAGRAYPCFCSRREIREAQSAPHVGGTPPVYPGTCRSLAAGEVRRRIESGRQYALRLCVAGAPRAFSDRFQGECQIDLGELGGDFVIQRADGLFAYQLACAVDDALSGVTEVVRGADLLDSGARQAWVLGSLGYSVPVYAHIPLMLDEDGRRLAKREGDDDLGAFVRGGWTARGVRSYLAATLGLCAPGEYPPLAELAGRFSWEAVPRGDVKLDRALLATFRGG